jgi:hypothetical protein
MVTMAIKIYIMVFQIVTLHDIIGHYQHFGRAYCFHLEGKLESPVLCDLFHHLSYVMFPFPDFAHFCPEGGGSVFLQNIGKHILDHMMS